VTTFLADTFRDLANDPRWPHQYKIEIQSPAKMKFTMARLALMVVEAMETPGYDLEYIFSNEGINPSHYVNVKERVGEAEEGK